MRVGLVARHGLCQLDHVGVHVGVHVVGHAHRRFGVDGADAAQQLAFAIFVALTHHGAVQVQQDAVKTATRHGLQNRLAHGLVGLVKHQPAGRGVRTKSQLEFGPRLLGQINERPGGRACAAKRRNRRVATRRRFTRPQRKTLQVGGHRREGVGLVHHHRNQQTHGRVSSSTDFHDEPVDLQPTVTEVPELAPCGLSAFVLCAAVADKFRP